MYMNINKCQDKKHKQKQKRTIIRSKSISTSIIIGISIGLIIINSINICSSIFINVGKNISARKTMKISKRLSIMKSIRKT